MSPSRSSPRGSFADTWAESCSAGRKALLLAPLGAGKTHTLRAIQESLQARAVPFVFIDLFTAASTPERMLMDLTKAVGPFMEGDADTVKTLADEGARDRHRASSALLRLLELLATGAPSNPFVWVVDEVTEIRSLAYFPDLAHIEGPLSRALLASGGAILSSSYLGLAADLFPDFDRVALPGLTSADLEEVPSLRSDSAAVATAIDVTSGLAATVLPLVADMCSSRDVTRSLIRLLQPGGTLEITCRRHYEVLLLKSRGYAVSKRAAEVVARAPNQRLTDLFPLIGRTAGASRQYLRWLVEVGLLTQINKRYDFADPILGLWAGLYLGRADPPTVDEIKSAVVGRMDTPRSTAAVALSDDTPKRRIDRFEEID